MFFHIQQEILIRSTYPALFIDFVRLAAMPGAVSYFSGQVNIAHGENTLVNELVERPLAAQEVVGLRNTDVVNGLLLLNQRRNDLVHPENFTFRVG